MKLPTLVCRQAGTGRGFREFTLKTIFTTHSPQEDGGSFETCLAGREHTEGNVFMENRAFAAS